MYCLYDLWLAEKIFSHPASVKKLCLRYNSAYEIYCQTASSLSKLADIPHTLISKLSDKGLGKAQKVLEECIKLDIKTVSYYSDIYPESLKEINDPPYLLFCKGDERILKDRFMLGIVGTRRMSYKGGYDAFSLSVTAARAGAVIVSGMALGIDAVSHLGAIAGRGRTVAVLGAGVDIDYPKQNRIIRQALEERGGVVISEYFPGYEPYVSNFPRRNRIISALSPVLAVAEASERSGALITANISLKAGRSVYVLPNENGILPAYGEALAERGAIPFDNIYSLLDEYRSLGIENVATQNEDITFPSYYMYETFVKTAEIPLPAAKVPYGYYADSAGEKITRSTKAEETNKTKYKPIPAEISSPKEKTAEESPKENRETLFAAMLEDCTLMGIVPDGEMRKVLELISKSESISADTLSLSGCKTNVVLQTVTLLVQSGRLFEGVGGIYKVNKSLK